MLADKAKALFAGIKSLWRAIAGQIADTFPKVGSSIAQLAATAIVGGLGAAGVATITFGTNFALQWFFGEPGPTGTGTPDRDAQQIKLVRTIFPATDSYRLGQEFAKIDHSPVTFGYGGTFWHAKKIPWQKVANVRCAFPTAQLLGPAYVAAYDKVASEFPQLYTPDPGSAAPHRYSESIRQFGSHSATGMSEKWEVVSRNIAVGAEAFDLDPSEIAQAAARAAQKPAHDLPPVEPIAEILLSNPSDKPQLILAVRTRTLAYNGTGIAGGGSGGALAYPMPVTTTMLAIFGETAKPRKATLPDPIVVAPHGFARIQVRLGSADMFGDSITNTVVGTVRFETSEGLSPETDPLCFRLLPSAE